MRSQLWLCLVVHSQSDSLWLWLWSLTRWLAPCQNGQERIKQGWAGSHEPSVCFSRMLAWLPPDPCRAWETSQRHTPWYFGLRRKRRFRESLQSGFCLSAKGHLSPGGGSWTCPHEVMESMPLAGPSTCLLGCHRRPLSPSPAPC